MKTIEIDVEVFAAIWRHHQAGDRNENDILRRQFLVERKPLVKLAGNRRRWIDDILDAFTSLGGKGYYADIYREVRKLRIAGGHRLPPSSDAIIRREIENHSSDSQAFLGKRDLFRAPKGIGEGYWELR